jgi:hypothetical protein
MNYINSQYTDFTRLKILLKTLFLTEKTIVNHHAS